MRILISHYGMIWKGGFSRTFPLAKGLSKLCEEVVIFTNQGGMKKFPYEKIIESGVTIYSFPDFIPKSLQEKGFGCLSVFLKIWMILKMKFDVVQTDTGHRPSSGLAVAVYKLFHPNVISIAEWWDFFGKGGLYDSRPLMGKLVLGTYDRLFENLNKKRADGVVALSSYTQNRALDLGIDKKRTKVIHGGAEVEKIPYVNDNTSIKKKYGFREDAFVFAFIGLVGHEVSDVLPFLEAMKSLKQNHNIQWFTTGGYLSDTIKQEYSVGDELIEFGWIDYNVYTELISCADSFLLIQRDNLQNLARWPNKLGDYMAAGRPTLCNTVGEIEGYYDTNPELFIPVELTKDSIYDKVKNIVDNQTMFKSRYKEIRNFAENNISWDSKAEQLFDFYRLLQH